MSGERVHTPVMVREVVALLDCGPGKTFVDATVGGGGHAAAILEATSPDGFLLGIDRDQEVLAEAHKVLERYDGRFKLRHSNFGDLGTVLREFGLERVDGILLDLGVSSWQVDRAERGFSFRSEAALDMRMDRSEAVTAERLIRKKSERELKKIIRNFGDERRAGMIARAIKKAGGGGARLSTTGLAAVVEGALGGRRPRRGRIHPATRTFQALRIAVNRELELLEETLEMVPSLLPPGGRCCCLSYHSLEDRIVKNTFRDLSGRGARDREARVEILTRKPVRPAAEEVRLNPRSRSARLRAVRRIGDR